MKFDKRISKFLAGMVVPYFMISSVGCIQLSAMEKSSEWELENSILPYMKTKTKLDFLTIFKEFMDNYIEKLEIGQQILDADSLYGDLIGYMTISDTWHIPEMYDSGNPFPSMTQNRKSSVLSRIKELCTSLSNEDMKGLRNFRNILDDKKSYIMNNPLGICKVFGVFDGSFDYNS